MDNQRIQQCLQAAEEYYEKTLRTKTGTEGIRYLKEERKLSEETLKKFHLGYAPKSDRLFYFLKSHGFKEREMVESGIMIEKNGKVYNRFFDRVMYPIFDENGKIISFGGRLLTDEQPKYLNGPETAAFSKSEHLFGLGCASKAGGKFTYIICEGYMDVISMQQAGFSKTVASLGTALTLKQAQLLSRYTKNAYLAYDNDDAGKKATLHAIDLMNKAGISVRIINMAPCKDPDQFIRTQGKNAFFERIKNATEPVMFLIEQKAEELGIKALGKMQDPDSSVKLLHYMTEVLQNQDTETKTRYQKILPDRYPMSYGTLWSDLGLKTDIEVEKEKERQNMKIHELKPGENKICLEVRQIIEKKTKKGVPYVSMMLSDGEQCIWGNMWEKEKNLLAFREGDVIETTLEIGQFNGRSNYTVSGMPAVKRKEQDVKPSSEQTKKPTGCREKSTEEIFAIIISCADGFVKHSDIGKLIRAIYADNAEKIIKCAMVPGQNKGEGSLLFHNFRMLNAAGKIATVYQELDSEILVAGALLHDIGMLKAISMNDDGTAGDTDEGILYGHAFLGAEMVREYGRKTGLTDESLKVLTHIIISHHAKPEWGTSIPSPSIAEACVLHELDSIDARMYQYEEEESKLVPGTMGMEMKGVSIYKPSFRA